MTVLCNNKRDQRSVNAGDRTQKCDNRLDLCLFIPWDFFSGPSSAAATAALRDSHRICRFLAVYLCDAAAIKRAFTPARDYLFYCGSSGPQGCTRKECIIMQLTGRDGKYRSPRGIIPDPVSPWGGSKNTMFTMQSTWNADREVRAEANQKYPVISTTQSPLGPGELCMSCCTLAPCPSDSRLLMMINDNRLFLLWYYYH